MFFLEVPIQIFDPLSTISKYQPIRRDLTCTLISSALVQKYKLVSSPIRELGKPVVSELLVAFLSNLAALLSRLTKACKSSLDCSFINLGV